MIEAKGNIRVQLNKYVGSNGYSYYEFIDPISAWWWRTDTQYAFKNSVMAVTAIGFTCPGDEGINQDDQSTAFDVTSWKDNNNSHTYVYHGTKYQDFKPFRDSQLGPISKALAFTENFIEIIIKLT